MKIGILGDFHLGYERFYEDSFVQAENAMREACSSSDVILLLGDLFDSKTPKPEVLSKAFKIFRIPFEKRWEAKLVDYVSKDGRKPFTNIPVVAIHGTHERRIKELVNPIQTLEHAGFLINAHSSAVVFEKDGERVAIQGFGGVPEEYAKNALLSLEFKPIENAFNILIFHQSIKELMQEVAPGISIEDLPKGFDLYLCGHIHTRKKEKMPSGSLLLVPGSTVITQLKKGEEAPKGLYIYDTSKREFEFREIETRPFFYEEIELKEASIKDINNIAKQTVEGILKKQSKKEPIIKLKLTGTLAKGLQPSNLDIQNLIDEFKGKAIVEVDKDFEFISLKEKIEKLRSLREQKLSVKELGMETLKEKLKEYNFGMKIDAESLFNLLSEEKDLEKALKKLLESS
jgi:DNA repair exonuclease SbcCD nuclease subunit